MYFKMKKKLYFIMSVYKMYSVLLIKILSLENIFFSMLSESIALVSFGFIGLNRFKRDHHRFQRDHHRFQRFY